MVIVAIISRQRYFRLANWYPEMFQHWWLILGSLSGRHDGERFAVGRCSGRDRDIAVRRLASMFARWTHPC